MATQFPNSSKVPGWKSQIADVISPTESRPVGRGFACKHVKLLLAITQSAPAGGTWLSQVLMGMLWKQNGSALATPMIIRPVASAPAISNALYADALECTRFMTDPL